MTKDEIVTILEEMANLLELKGENPFKVRAYRNAARALLSIEGDLGDLIREKKLTDTEGIGDHIAKRITILATKGRLPLYEKLKRSVPKGLLDLVRVQGLGPKKVQILYHKLHIQSISALKKAAEKGRIAKIKGFGARTEKNIIDALSRQEKFAERHLWWDAMETATPILSALRKLPGVKEADIAGSVRRARETIGDLDFLVGANSPKPIMKWFISQPFVSRVLSQGESKTSIVSTSGMQMDLRVIPVDQYPFALLYFTGSKEHNIKLREMAIEARLVAQRIWDRGQAGPPESFRQKAPEKRSGHPARLRPLLYAARDP